MGARVFGTLPAVLPVPIWSHFNITLIINILIFHSLSLFLLHSLSKVNYYTHYHRFNITHRSYFISIITPVVERQWGHKLLFIVSASAGLQALRTVSTSVGLWQCLFIT
jgi:hypothetical protein